MFETGFEVVRTSGALPKLLQGVSIKRKRAVTSLREGSLPDEAGSLPFRVIALSFHF